MQNQDPLADFAIARVSRDTGGSVQAQAGGGLALGSVPKPGAVVTVTGYEMGVGGGPISCTEPRRATKGRFPRWTARVGRRPVRRAVDRRVDRHGLIGGLDGGGCDESVSYSPPFDDAVARLLARAEAGGPPTSAPTVFDDDCD